MFSTLWSYLTRFGRLALLTLAVVVVIILVFFTFNSTKSDDSQVANETSSVAVEESGSTSGDQNYSYDSETGEASGASSGTGIDSNDSTTVSTTGETGHVSSTSTAALPDTGLSGAATTALGLMALSAGAIGYKISRQNLSQKLLELNR